MMEIINLKNCYITEISKSVNVITCKLHTPIFDITFDFKVKRRNLNVGTVYMYIGNLERPIVEKFGLYGIGGDFPKLTNLKEWSLICLNLMRFKVLKHVRNILDESAVNSLYYDLWTMENPKPKQKLLWE